MLDWITILQKGMESLAGPLFKSALAVAGKNFRDKDPYQTLDFTPHLSFAFNRCTQIKTLLNREAPVSMLEQYVTLQHRCKGEVIDDFDLIDRIWAHKRVLVTSTGGGGKSMFMRYFWISTMVKPRGKIPIYIELRRINELDRADFETFMFHEAVKSSHSSALGLFKQGLKEGQYVLVLDGFDEINHDRRPNVEASLLSLANENSELIIVVAGRPDFSYDAWQSFVHFSVEPLSRDQTSKLIEQLPFDAEIKKRFQRRLKKGDFDRHTSFLERPLLVTMMLLSFEYHADVPEKIHLFYEQAFDALFYIHDRLKESFTRKRYTNYSIDVFKRKLGYFCLATYNEGAISFTRTRLNEFVEQAGRLDGNDIDTDNFVKDMLESVCFLQEDGLSITFTHRSFQEYFCAYCLSRMSPQRAERLLGRFSARWQDTVVQLCHEINRPLVEDAFLLPLSKECSASFKGRPKEISVEDLLRNSDSQILYYVDLDTNGRSSVSSVKFYSGSRFMASRECLASILADEPRTIVNSDPENLFRSIERFDKTLLKLGGADQAFLIRVRADFSEVLSAPRYSTGVEFFEDLDESSAKQTSPDLHSELLETIGTLGVIQQAISDIKIVLQSLRKLNKRVAQRGESLEELLSYKTLSPSGPP